MENNLIQKDIIKTHKKDLSEKTERIVTGIYLVSSLISDREPLKWELREKALKTFDVSQRGDDDRVAELCEDMIHLVSLGERSALISRMNADLLGQGLRSLSTSVTGTPMLRRHQLEIARPQEDIQEREKQTQVASTPTTPAPQIKDTQKSPTHTGQPKRQTTPKKTSSRKDKRQQQVLEALGKKKESSIKDIARQVRGCSEKTIQRELNTLIANGSVLKKGERRWSVYMLA